MGTKDQRCIERRHHCIYNQLDQIVVGREDAFRFYTGPPPIGPFDTEPYANLGGGRIYGAESQLRYDGANTTALVAATYSRSRETKEMAARACLPTISRSS